MATRFARVDLSDNARDFQPIALEPGLPMLDKSGTNAKILHKWLDCLVAEPEWEGDAVNFYLRDKSGGRLEGVPCRPATAKRLQGPLKAELDELDQRIRAARPKSATERLVHKGLSQALRNLKSDPNRADLSCYLFEYRDVDRNPRLVWCWGFQRVDGQDASAAVCPNSGCNQLFVKRPGGSSKCPNCHRPVVRKPLPWKRIAAVTALLLLLGVVGWLWWSTRPSAILAGQVVSVADKKPIRGAEIRIVGTSRTTETDDRGRFRIEHMPAGSTEVKVLRAGFEPKTMSAEMTAREETWLDVKLLGTESPYGRVVDAATDMPISGAKVSIEGSDLSALLTDEDGEFRFVGADVDSAQISVGALGYRDELVSWASGSNPTVVKLSGNVTLEGQVIDDATGNPVPGAEIRVADTEYGAQTDGTGRFSLESLRGVATDFEVAAPGFAHRQLTVNPAEEPSIEIRLAGGADLTGRVVAAATGEPVVDATVNIAETKLKAQTDAEGKYAISGIPAGNAKVQVSATGFQATDRDANVLVGDNQPVDFALRGSGGVSGVVVYGGSDQSANFPIPGAKVIVNDNDSLKAETDASGRFSIEGVPPGPAKVKVTAPSFRDAEVQWDPSRDSERAIALAGDASVSGRVVDGVTNAPIAEAEVSIQQSPLAARTDGDGRFRIEGVRSGPAEVKVAASGYRDPTPLALSLPPNQDTATEVIKLTGDSTLVGSVLNLATQKPVPNAEIRIEGTGYSARSDNAGRFRLENVPSGTRTVKVLATGFKPWEAGQVLEPDKETPIDVPLGGDATVAGRVVDATTGDPIAQAGVQIANTPLRTTTDREGRFRLEGAFGGPVTVQVSAAGYNAPPPLQAKLASAAATDVGTVKLQGNGSVIGQVLGTDGRTPVPGAKVSVAGTGYTSQTDPKGVFRLDHVPSGAAQTIEISAPDHRTETRQVSLLANKPAMIEPVRMQSSIVLSGTVVDATTGNPVSGAEVRVVGTDLVAQTDGSGTFRIEAAPSDSLKLSISGEGIRTEIIDANPTIERGNPNAPRRQVRAVVSPMIPPGQVRIVLTWGYSPPDLDAHLYWPQGTSRAHVYHKKRELLDQRGQALAVLDVDATHGNGPETITIKKLLPGTTYQYLVHHFEGKGSSSTPLAGSDALVRVYTSDKDFSFPVKKTAGNATRWRVFFIQTDTSGRPAVHPFPKDDATTYDRAIPPE